MGSPAEAERSADAVPAKSDDGIPATEVEARLRLLEERIRQLQIRNTDFRNKIFAIQQVVVERMGLVTCPVGMPGAEIFPVEARPAPVAPVRVLAFDSMGANFGLPPKQFFNSLQPRDCDILFLKDFRQCWYQQGLLGLTRNIPETAAFLRRLVESDGRPVVTVGASSGGFAAILFGALLGARRVLAFSPQTLVTDRVFHRFRTEDSDISEIAFDSAYTDLRSVLAQHPLRGEMRLYFGERAPFDAAEARRLEGLPGAVLCPLPWNGHNTAQFLQRRGELAAVLDWLLAT